MKKRRIVLPEMERYYAGTLHKDIPEYKAGQRYVGVTNTTKDRDPTKPWGYWGSVLPMTGKPAWRTPLIDLPSWSGAMVTAGGLVFTGNNSGDFVALDEDSGKILWQFKTASGVTSQPITYTYKGKQYVSILSGLGGGTSSRRETGGKVLPAGSVWTFALMD